MSYLTSAYAFILVIIFGYIIRVNVACKKRLGEMESLGIEPSKQSKFDKPGVRLGLSAVTVSLILIALYMALVWSPDAVGEPDTYRIIYFHVASAIMSYIGFFITFVGGILFLKNKDLKYDRWAKAGADLGIHFCMLMIVSGMIWGKQRWGAWWIWEPRLTSALILMIIYVGYLILRHVLDEASTRARYAAVYGIIAFLDVPMVHYAIKFWGSIMHPVIKDAAKKSSGLSPDMTITLQFSQAVFLLTFVTLFIIRLRVDTLDSEIERHRAKEKHK